MKPNKENIRPILVRMLKAGHLPADGPISLFLEEDHRTWRGHRQQFVVSVRGDAVFVRFSRLPFARPIVYSLQDLKANP